MRLLEKLAPKRAPIGLDGPPADEVARFRAHLSMSFPPSQIVALDPPDEEHSNPLLTVTFMGLYGPSGVLPLHYTQLLMDIQRDVRGPERRSLRAWLDLFDHRFISLFYRAWEKYRFHLQYERGEAFRATPDTFTLGIRSLMGWGTHGLTHRLGGRRAEAVRRVPDWSDTAEPPPALPGSTTAVALRRVFAQRPRNATNLPTLLADYFRLPFAVQQFRGQWLAIPVRGRPRLGEFGSLGIDAVAGERTWDVQSRFRVRVGPLTYLQFEDLLPDPAAIKERKTFFLVAQMARLFAGSEFDFDIQLVLAGPEVPEAQLTDAAGAGPRLGWTVWLISGTPDDADDAVFDAEWVTVL